jgi:hypothetical protein
LASLEIPFLLRVNERLTPVAMFAARPPIASTGTGPMVTRSTVGNILARLLRRRPEFASREILHFRVRMAILDAIECGQ